MALENTLSTPNQTWKAYDQWIEFNADQAAYKAASPENALVMIGPTRVPTGTGTNLLEDLKPIGLLQNFTIGQSINWQAQQMIGSGRTFFLAGKAPGNGTITRLFTSTSTLLGAIYQVARAKIGSDADNMESPAYDPSSSSKVENPKNIMFTLDSELLKIPVGMCALFRDTMRRFIGGFYVESMVIPNLNIGFAVGQPAVFETVNIIFDRVVPFDKPGEIMNSQLSNFDEAVQTVQA